MEKGTHGYLDQKRKTGMIKVVVNLLVIIIIFVIGLLLTKTKSNYFTVAAVLLTIPLAYFVTGLAAIGSFRSLSREKMQEFATATGTEANGQTGSGVKETKVSAVTACDLVLTVKEKQLYAGVVLFTSAEVVLYTENVKKLYEFRENLSGVLKSTGYFSGVYLTDDWSDFMNRVHADLAAEKTIREKDTAGYEKQLIELEKQKERLLIYSV